MYLIKIEYQKDNLVVWCFTFFSLHYHINHISHINYGLGQVTFAGQSSAETATGTFSCGGRCQVLLQKGNQRLHKAGQQKEVCAALKTSQLR